MNRNDNGEKQLETREVEASTTTVMVLPTDILMGQGATRYNNPGNVAFRELIKEHVVQYEKDAPRKEKAALVKLLISKIDEKGHRFLHESPAGTWVEASSEKAKKKVAHALRDARRALTKNDGAVLPTNVLPDCTEPRPSSKDIMPGQGATCYNNPGNEVYRKLVEEKVDEYYGKAKGTEKPAFVEWFISEMKAMGYRFLHRSENGSLVEAPEEDVKKKVTHDFRNARARLTKKPSSAKDKRDETSDNTAVIETVVQTHCQTTPTEEFPPAEGESQEAEVSFFVIEKEENTEHGEIGGHVNNISEQWPRGPLLYTSEMEPRLEQCDGNDDVSTCFGIPIDWDGSLGMCLTDVPYSNIWNRLNMPFDSELEEMNLLNGFDENTI
ncbi:hypothetical protein MHU86_10115 [Fragilaria crotonensis]|nr:hypothetical protein MHU86_10115 [Fragilaria crotonensis]